MLISCWHDWKDHFIGCALQSLVAFDSFQVYQVVLAKRLHLYVLALHGVHIVMGVRNTNSGRKVREVILEENSNAKIDVKELDLNSMASARNFSLEFNSLGLPLNLLIINAGVFASPFMLSQDNKIAVWDKSFRYSRIKMVFVERIFVISYCKRLLVDWKGSLSSVIAKGYDIWNWNWHCSLLV